MGKKFHSRGNEAVTHSEVQPRPCELAVLGLSVLGSAYLMATAIGPHGYPFAGWFSLFPLFVCISVLSAWQAGLAGALWGAGIYLFAVTGTLGAPHSGTAPGLETFLLLTAAPAAYTSLAAWLTRRIGFSPFVLGVGWLGVELVFSRLNLNIGLLGPAQPEGNVLYWLAHALGSIFVGFIIAYVNAACVNAAARIGIGQTQTRPVACAPSSNRWLEPQTFSCLPRFTVRALQPRAPPQ